MIPVYVQLPNKPSTQMHVGEVADHVKTEQVVKEIGLNPENIIGVRMIRNREKGSRWLIVSQMLPRVETQPVIHVPDRTYLRDAVSMIAYNTVETLNPKAKHHYYYECRFCRGTDENREQVKSDRSAVVHETDCIWHQISAALIGAPIQTGSTQAIQDLIGAAYAMTDHFDHLMKEDGNEVAMTFTLAEYDTLKIKRDRWENFASDAEKELRRLRID